MLTSLDYYLHTKNLRYWLIPSRNIDDQRILSFDWTKDTTGCTQSKNIVADATFSSREYLHAKNLRYWLILSRDIEDQRIPQSDWLIAFRTITEEPDFSYTCSFSRIIKSISCTIFRIKANKCILEEFLGFSPKMRTFLKNWAAPVFAF